MKYDRKNIRIICQTLYVTVTSLKCAERIVHIGSGVLQIMGDRTRETTENSRALAKTVRHRDAVSALSCYQSKYMASEAPRSPCDFSYTRELSFLTSFAGHIGCYNDGLARFNIHCTAKEHASTDVPLQFQLLLCARHRA